MSKAVTLLVASVLLLATPAPAAPQPGALPDLVVSAIIFDHVTTYKNAQGSTCFNFLTSYTITNRSRSSAAGTGANMDVTAMNTGQFVFFSSVQGCGTLAPGASVTVPSQPQSAQNWCFDSPRRVKVRITVDPPDPTHARGNVLESNELNNVLEKEFVPPLKPVVPLPPRP